MKERVRYIEALTALALVLLSSGCGRLKSAEYNYPLIGDWYFSKSSGTTAQVVLRKPHDSRTPFIPSMVTHIAWNDTHIIAKQRALIEPGHNNGQGQYVGPSFTTNFWILDLTDYEHPQLSGPLNMNDFSEQLKELGLDNKLALQETDSYRPTQH